MMKKILTMLVMCLAAVAMAEYTIELQDDMKIRLGGDIRARYEGYTFNVAAPDVDKDGRHSTEYFRIRTRLWGAFDFGEDVTFNLRLANRFHYVTTSPNRDNNNGKSTWEFPDEVYVDSANIEIRNLLDGLLTIKLGRQDLGFGNGMLFAEGTPFDQGRSVFTDGITLKFKTENDTVTIFTLYDASSRRASIGRTNLIRPSTSMSTTCSTTSMTSSQKALSARILRIPPPACTRPDCVSSANIPSWTTAWRGPISSAAAHTASIWTRT